MLKRWVMIGCVLAGCSSDAESTGNNGGSAGSGGGAGAAGGSAGVAGGGATAGSANGGNAGSSGNAGSAGNGGTAGAGGSAGSAGNGGTAGTGGVWQPAPGTSWQWQLTETIDHSVDVAMYDIDLFDTPAATIQQLHAAGRKVICYFSAGSREDWRPDAGDFAAADYGEPLDGWAGETWLDVRSANVKAIMSARLDLALSKKCDGVEPDNVDGYSNDSGFPLTSADQLAFNRYLADQAHARGLSVGLKNAVELVPQLVAEFDWALNEECLSYNECDELAPFISAGKAVLHVEYVDAPGGGNAKLATVCGGNTTNGFSTLVKTWDLDAWRLACP